MPGVLKADNQNSQTLRRVVRALLAAFAIAVCSAASPAAAQVSAHDAIGPDLAVELDIDRYWRTSRWAGSESNETVALTRDEGRVTFHVKGKGRRHVWVTRFDFPVDPNRFPQLVMTYRATGLGRTGAYAIWCDDGTGPERGGIHPINTKMLKPDGQVHEVRRDLRELSPAGPIEYLALSVHADQQGDAEFELISLRFQIDTSDKTRYPPPADDRPMTFRVVNEWGDPVEGATVASDGSTINYRRAAATNALGLATIVPFDHNGLPHSIHVSKPGYASPIFEGVTQQGDQPTELLLRKARSFAGVIVDEQGRPLAGAGVAAVAFIEGEPPRGVQRVVYDPPDSQFTDEDGFWQVDNVHADALFLRANHPDYRRSTSYNIEIRQPLDENHALDHSKLPHSKLMQGQTITGSVMDQAGEPIAGARVELVSISGGYLDETTRADRQGLFEIDRMPEGAHVQLTITAAGKAPALVDFSIEKQNEPVKVTMTAGSEIRGRIVDHAGKPVPGVAVVAQAWRASRNLWLRAFTDRNGVFTLRNAPEDDVHFILQKRGWQTIEGVSMHAAGSPYELTMRPLRQPDE